MKHLRANSFLADRGARLGGIAFAQASQAPDREAAPTGHASGAADFISSTVHTAGGKAAPSGKPSMDGAATTRGSAAVEAHSAHTREVAGSTPAPATILHSPATLAGDDGHPGIPSPDALAAGRGAVPYERAKSGQAVTISEASASITSCADSVGRAAPETAPAVNPFPCAPAGAVTVYHQEPHVEAVPDSGVMHEARHGEGSQPCLPSDRVENKPRATAVIAGAPLSEASAFVLSLVAAHEGRSPEDVLALLIVGAAEAIGIHSLIMRDAHHVDLADVPDFALRAANRFRGGGP